LLKGYICRSTGTASETSVQQELHNGQAHAANPVCPGHLSLQMLAALALLRPISDLASERKLWVENLVEELSWAASVLKEGSVACFSQGHEHLLPLLAQASFSVGQLSLEWRCWDATKKAMDMAALFAGAWNKSRNNSSDTTLEALIQAVEAVTLHALLQQRSAAQLRDADTQAALSRGCASSGMGSVQERARQSCLTQKLLMPKHHVSFQSKGKGEGRRLVWEALGL
ncbi:hypothetical protein DUNSADRAFT_4221, partial [Dunaliella salina]